MTAARVTLEEVKQRLHARAFDLARELAPGGRLKGANYWARNPQRRDGGNLSSFSVNVQRGIWKDFALAEGGDMFKFVAVFACAGDYKRAWRWSLDWLGLTGHAPDPAETARIQAQAENLRAAEARKLAKWRKQAMAIFLAAKPLDGHDIASEYLAGRGIDIHAFPAVPNALRWHPKVYPRTGGPPFAAMVGAITLEGLPHGLASVHLTYLERRNGRVCKAVLPDPEPHSKEVLCAYSGGSVRLCKGNSGAPLARAPEGEAVLIGEGIENTLSAALAYPELRALAAVSLANIANVALPPQIKHVTLIADNDAPGSKAAEGFERVEQALVDRGLEVKIARADPRFKDFNDALCGVERKVSRGDAETRSGEAA